VSQSSKGALAEALRVWGGLPRSGLSDCPAGICQGLGELAVAEDRSTQLLEERASQDP